MGYLVKGLMFIGLAALFAWFFYSIFISATSRFGFIDSDQQSYQKNCGTITAKEMNEEEYALIFTYPEETNIYQGRLVVSEREYSREQIGDKIPIFYGIQNPARWLPIRSGKVFWGGVVLIIAILVCFLIGATYFYRLYGGYL